MKFGLDQIGRRTPLMLANIGHGLISASLAATVHLTINPSSYPKLAFGVQFGGFLGYLLVNLFGENKNVQ